MTKTYLKLLLYLSKLLSKDGCLFSACINLLFEDLCPSLEDLNQARLSHVTDVVPFVLNDDALGAYIDGTIFTEELGALIWVLQAVLFGGLVLSLQFLFFKLVGYVLFAVEVVKDCEVFNQLLDVGAEVAAASGACEYVAGAKVHKAMLTESVPTGENARDLLLVVVLVEADRARHFHPVLLVSR